jgi:MFS family permease
MMNVILFIFGLGAGGQSVSFGVVKDNNPIDLVGTACGFNNLSVLIGGAVFQPLVGVILKHSGSAHVIQGVSVYDVATYQKALIILPICYFISLIVVKCFMKESHPDSAKS